MVERTAGTVTYSAPDTHVLMAVNHIPDAFGKVYEKYNEAIFRYARRLTGNTTDAEEITAQTFVKAFAALPRFEWRNIPLDHWLYRIARNAAYDARGACLTAPLDAAHEIPSGDLSPEHQALRHERLVELRTALAKLPPRQRTVVYEHFSIGLTYREIAQQRGVSAGAVKQLIHRALVSLRAMLAEDDTQDFTM